MKTEYKTINFVEEKKGLRSEWSCCNNGNKLRLGIIKWYNSRREYCFFSVVGAIYSKDGLDDIRTFLAHINTKNK